MDFFMGDIRPEPGTIVEQTLDKLSEASKKFTTTAHGSSFKIRQNLTKPYISITGPEEYIRVIYDMMKQHFPAEEIHENRVPKTTIGYYQEGETPFGIVPPAMHRTRMVVRFCDLTETDLKKLNQMYHAPEAFLSASIPGHQVPARTGGWTQAV